MRYLILVLAFVSSLGLPMSTSTVPEFPPLQGTSLAEVDVEIPGQLEGRLNLVILAFVRKQQEDVDTWIPASERLEEEFSGFRFYEVPFLSSIYTPFRNFIDGGMRSGIPDQRARRRTITVYGGRNSALRTLGVDDTRTIYVFLIARDGQIFWRSEGQWAAEKDAELRSVLAAKLDASK